MDTQIDKVCKEKLTRNLLKVAKYNHAASSFLHQQRYEQAMLHFSWTLDVIDNGVDICKAGLTNGVDKEKYADHLKLLMALRNSIETTMTL